jgi:hypothetical protein
MFDSAQELAQSLWSLAKAKQNRPKLLRRLGDHATTLVAEFNERDMSTVVWAFGSLQYNPGKALLDGIAAVAVARIHDFQPQVSCSHHHWPISMSLYKWCPMSACHVPISL